MQMRQIYRLQIFLLNIVQEVLTTAVEPKQEINDLSIAKKERSFYLFTNNMTAYIENLKE